jgi:hypothetical protein
VIVLEHNNIEYNIDALEHMAVVASVVVVVKEVAAAEDHSEVAIQHRIILVDDEVVNERILLFQGKVRDKDLVGY